MSPNRILQYLDSGVKVNPEANMGSTESVQKGIAQEKMRRLCENQRQGRELKKLFSRKPESCSVKS
jgi:hypothetical protein